MILVLFPWLPHEICLHARACDLQEDSLENKVRYRVPYTPNLWWSAYHRFRHKKLQFKGISPSEVCGFGGRFQTHTHTHTYIYIYFSWMLNQLRKKCAISQSSTNLGFPEADMYVRIIWRDDMFQFLILFAISSKPTWQSGLSPSIYGRCWATSGQI